MHMKPLVSYKCYIYHCYDFFLRKKNTSDGFFMPRIHYLLINATSEEQMTNISVFNKIICSYSIYSYQLTLSVPLVPGLQSETSNTCPAGDWCGGQMRLQIDLSG